MLTFVRQLREKAFAKAKQYQLALRSRMKYWWVNHKKTHSQEVGGGYMWSPITETNGNFSQYYLNMRLARSGDQVISYASGAIRALGTVLDGAIVAPRPEEFGKAGENWSMIGWLVPVAWLRIPPLRPKSILAHIAPLLPTKYSPLSPRTGNGHQKAYLSEVPQALFEVVASAAQVSPPQPLPAVVAADIFRDELENAEELRIQRDKSLQQTEREQLCKARRGQGDFRKNLFALEKRCRLSGIETPSLLIASHIKPWRSCTSAEERLDGNNGLLLSPNADRVFDRGLISFGADGTLLRSPYLALSDLSRLNLPMSMQATFSSTQHRFLEYHREVIFQS